MFLKVTNIILAILGIFVIFLIYKYNMIDTKELKEDLKSIEIGFAPWPGFDVLYYGKIKNIFKAHDVNVKLVRFQDQEAATQALSNLEIDAAMISIWDVLHIHGANDFDIILTTNVSNGADGIVSIKSVKSVKELKNKQISAQKNSVNELILLEALQSQDMNMDDVSILDITNEQALSKLFHGEIDAAVLWEPLLSQTNKKINGNILFTTKEVNSLVIDLLVVQSTSISKNPKEWKNFLLSWYEIMQSIETNPKDVFDSIAFKTDNPSFSQDYAGLKAGTISLNKDMFLNNRLKYSIDKISELIPFSVDSARLHINSSFAKDAIECYEKKCFSSN